MHTDKKRTEGISHQRRDAENAERRGESSTTPIFLAPKPAVDKAGGASQRGPNHKNRKPKTQQHCEQQSCRMFPRVGWCRADAWPGHRRQFLQPERGAGVLGIATGHGGDGGMGVVVGWAVADQLGGVDWGGGEQQRHAHGECAHVLPVAGGGWLIRVECPQRSNRSEWRLTAARC